MRPRPLRAPRLICAVCLEFLPHYCAAVVVVRRGQFGRKIVTITDRAGQQPAGGGGRAARDNDGGGDDDETV